MDEAPRQSVHDVLDNTIDDTVVLISSLHDTDDKLSNVVTLGLKSDDNDNEEDNGVNSDDEGDELTPNESTKKKKKKNKKPKKKKTDTQLSNEDKSDSGPLLRVPSLLPHSRNVSGFTDYYISLGQTNPPTIPVIDLFPRGEFPVGQELPHHVTRHPDVNSSYVRMTEAEKRDNERILKFDLYEKVSCV